MLAEIFDDALLGVPQRLVVDIVFPCFEHNDLAQDAEAGVHAALVGEIEQELLVGSGARFTPLEEVIAHLVGEIDEIHLAETETLLGNRVVILIIIVAGQRGDGDFRTLEDEPISRADIFIETALGKTDQVEKLAGVELAPGGHRETVFAEHGAETLHSIEDLFLGMGGWLGGVSLIRVDFAEAADGQVEPVLVAEAMERINHFWPNRIVGIDESDPFAGGDFEAGVAGGGEALIRLMDDLNAGIFLREDVAEGSTHVGRAVVDEDDLEVRVDLATDGLDAALEDFRDVVNRDDDRDDG